MMATILELDECALDALNDLCKEAKMNPSAAIMAAVMAYRRQRANELYLGTGLLELVEDHPSETKRAVKKALKEKHGYSA